MRRSDLRFPYSITLIRQNRARSHTAGNTHPPGDLLEHAVHSFHHTNGKINPTHDM